jgi:hypothetical protein
VLAAGFIATSLFLAIIATHQGTPRSILDQPAAPASEPTAPPAPAAPHAPVAQ